MPEQQQIKILNVNDDDSNRYALSRILRKAGFEVLEAVTGAEALQQLADRPDLVLLDVQLPDLSGFEVCQRIKGDPATAGVAVVHLSAHFVETEDRAQGLDCGADAYLVHPVEARELVATVKAMLRVRSAEQEARAAARDWQVTFDAISDAICLLDARGHVRRCNRAMAAFLRQPREQVVGRPYRELLQTALGSLSETFLGFADLERRQVFERLMDGRWYRISTDPVFNDRKDLTEIVQVVADVTDEKKAAEAERELQARARQIERLQHEMTGLEGLIRRLDSPE